MTMSQDITIRRATRNDLPEIETFIARTYGATAPYKDSARWYWQFMDNPQRRGDDKSRPTVWIACIDARVIGQIALQEGNIWVDGEHLPASWIVDVMIDPEFRGLGLGHCIHAALMQERSILITLTMAPATRRIAEKAGCITLGKTSQYICPHMLSGSTIRRFLQTSGRGKRITPLIDLFAGSWIGPQVLSRALRGWSALRRNIGRHGHTKVGTISEISKFDAEFDTLWQETRDAHTPSFARDTSFLNWRFCTVPGLSYRRFALHDKDGLQGYLVTRVGHSVELPLGVIADIYARDGDPAVLDMLLNKAKDVLSECEFIEAAASREDYRKALSRAGFIELRHMRPTIVCTDPATKKHLSQHIDDWHFTKADHDWDQIHPAD